jgi:acetyl-CoA carboxylase carboxyltransferase component
VSQEELGGARMHTTTSGVAHHMAASDEECLTLIRQTFRSFPAPAPSPQGRLPAAPADTLYEILPGDHRLPYDVQRILDALVDAGDYLEFQPGHAPELICATARLDGRPIGLIANRRGFLKVAGQTRVGGIVYTESARKAAYFVENCERLGLPLLYVQDVSGFMVGVKAETEGIIRAGAGMVETMSCTTVPRITLTTNHASGAGYYAMAGQGFDPHFTFAWPTARIGVMEGDAAVQAVHGPEIERCRQEGIPLPEELAVRINQTRADYERWLDSHYAAARGHADALIDPLSTRAVLALVLDLCCARFHRAHLPEEILA